jgi:diphthine-ammonia ligase
MKQGGLPKYLFTMLTEDGKISRSHGLPRTLLEQQALQLGIPIIFNSATWDHYEIKFQQILQEYMLNRIEYGVFGDIDVESHRDWCIRMCAANNLGVFHPLWKRSRKELMKEFIDLGFEAVIVATQADKLGSEWLGRKIDHVTMKVLEKTGIDMCGESGEYHTLVTGGPIFKSKLIFKTEKVVSNDGYWFLKVSE